MIRVTTLTFLLISLWSRAQVFNGGGGPILNNGQNTYYPVTVTGLSQSQLDTSFGVKQVCFSLSHPDLRELTIYLQSPSGMQVQLTIGSSCSGNSYTNTCFDSSDSTSVTLGNAPYTGTWKPIGYLGRFNNGQAANGTWKLIVKDYLAFFNAGNLYSWSITFGSNPPHPVPFSSSNLPLVIINTNNQTISNAHILVNMGIVDNGPNRNYVTDPWNDYNAKAMVHLRGHSSLNCEKKSYTVETRNASGITTDASLLGMPSENDWLLVAPYQDKSLIRIPLTYDLFRNMGHYAPRYRNVELVINNQYQGTYMLMEQPKRDSARIHISKLKSTENTFPDITGGYILKIDRSDVPGWFSLYPGNSPSGSRFYYQYIYPDDSDITMQQQAYIKSVLDSFETVMNSPNYANPYTGYSKYIDVGSFVDFFIMNELSKNVDAYRLSTFLYKDKITKGGKIYIGPVWDYDIAWHNCNYGNAASNAGWEYQLPDTAYPSPMWWNRFMQDSNFVNRLYCRWHELRQGILALNNLYAYIDSSALALNESQQRNFIQWPIIGAYIYPNPQNQNNASYLSEVADLKNWVAARVGWMDWAIQGHCPILTNFPAYADGNSISVSPNPMESSTTFSLRLAENADVSLSIADVVGRQVAMFLNGNTPAGESKIVFDRQQLPAGIYIYQVQINKSVKTGKLVIQ